jgi:hypothetical protein
MAVELNALGAAALHELLKSLALLDIVVANIELGQRPSAADGISKGNNNCRTGACFRYELRRLNITLVFT